VRVVDQQVMNQLFEVIDEVPLSREAVTVPLLMEGEGTVTRRRDGKLEITLPDAGDLAPFLAALPARLLALAGPDEPE
jgi:hypothetical protein